MDRDRAERLLADHVSCIAVESGDEATVRRTPEADWVAALTEAAPVDDDPSAGPRTQLRYRDGDDPASRKGREARDVLVQMDGAAD